MHDRPLATLVLYAFNEEGFVQVSVEGAFRQTYSPLEIVLSDDGSTDRTFALMEESARAYRGAHKVVLNRNEKNTGIGSQINAACERSRGELVILANADDISEPDRVERVVAAWESTGRTATAITHNLSTIDATGNALHRVIDTKTTVTSLESGVRRRFGGVQAASLALSRAVFDAFGPLHPNLILEDNAMYMRAVLLGERIHLDDCLVRYRIHADNISQAYALDEYEVWRRRHHEKLIWQRREGGKAYVQMLADLHAPAAEAWPAADLRRSRRAAAERMLALDFETAHYTGDPALPLSDAVRTVGRLALQVGRLGLRRMVPWLQARSDRWHYQRAVEAARES